MEPYEWKGLVIGLVGVYVTAKAYDQDYVSQTTCLLLGLVILVLGLIVKEGYTPL